MLVVTLTSQRGVEIAVPASMEKYGIYGRSQQRSLNRSSAMRNGHNVEIPIPDRTESIHGRMLRHSAAERCKKLSTHSAPWTVNSEA